MITIARVLLFVLLLTGLSARDGHAQEGRSAAMSPFDAVEWRGDPATADGEPGRDVIVRVKVGQTWYVLDAINGTPTPSLLKAIGEIYGPRHITRRFEEDLIEAMEKLGVPPGPVARLDVRPDADAQPLQIEAEWSHDKRQALRRRAREREQRPGGVPLRVEDVRAALDSLETLLATHGAYAVALGGGDEPAVWRSRLLRAREHAAALTSEHALTREVRRVVAGIGDAHASVSGPEPDSERWLPFLPVSLGAEGPVLAARPDRSAFLLDQAPVIVAIDGVGIERWLAAASEFVARASPQLVRERSCRMLRDVEMLRPLAAPDAVGRGSVRLELASIDGTTREQVELSLTPNKPLYGAWPEGHSRLLPASAAAGRPVGYIRLAEMNRTSGAETRRMLNEFSGAGASSLVVDVRGNGGGSRDALFVLAGAILDPGADPVVINAARPLKVGGTVPETVAEQLGRRGLRPESSSEWTTPEQRAIAQFKQRFAPQLALADDRFDGWWFACASPVQGDDAPRWTGNTVVLHDAACFSATDVFLAAMKELPRVTLVGEPSAGGSGAAREHPLPRGISVRLSSMVSFQPSGQLFDGVGVFPDVTLAREPRDVLRGEDRWLLRAIALALQEP